MPTLRTSGPAPSHALDLAAELMLRFAARTGLSTRQPPRRYLWTDAFAVRNFLTLAQRTGDAHHRDLALHLVDQVHAVLGRHRPDDARRGWLSGLDDHEGALHPTRGGLRIGKPLPERVPSEPLDERLEWDREGQYFHYLTQWSRTLDEVSRFTGEVRYHRQARELAAVAHTSFKAGGAQLATSPDEPPRLAWKMSVDLTRPLVPSMGHHDPLEGFLTFLALQPDPERAPDSAEGADLRGALADLALLVEGTDWTTTDPLGLGGLLTDLRRTERLLESGALGDESLFEAIVIAARVGLSRYVQESELRLPASHRLAFRELGLAIGLADVARTLLELSGAGRSLPGAARRAALLATLAPYQRLGPAIVGFWLASAHRSGPAWMEHADLNDVMLATSLLPAQGIDVVA
jgi:hypothetical protein